MHMVSRITMENYWWSTKQCSKELGRSRKSKLSYTWTQTSVLWLSHIDASHFNSGKRWGLESNVCKNLTLLRKFQNPLHGFHIVAAPKPKNLDQVRNCVDMKLPIQAIKIVSHLMPKVDDIIHNLIGVTSFSKINLSSDYCQLELHPNSHSMTTFSTHLGLRWYWQLTYSVFNCRNIPQRHTEYPGRHTQTQKHLRWHHCLWKDSGRTWC